MSAQLHGRPHGLPNGASHGTRAATVSAKARQGKAPDLTGPDLSFVGAPFHHVVTYVTREGSARRVIDALALALDSDDMDAATRRRFA